MTSLLLVAVAASLGHANQSIPVVDASPGVSGQVVVPQSNISATQGATSSSAPAGAQGVQLYYQLESLQQEVQELRGIVEQQEYQIKQMREEQRDRYLDLDRRISSLNQAGSSPASVQPASPVVSQQPAQPIQPSVAPVQPKAAVGAPSSKAPAPDMAGEKKAYQAAFALVRNKQYAQAGSAFRQLVKDYPDGHYTGNAYYWLGEVLLVESEHEQALKAFGSLLGNFPDHRKAADAKYKQGKIYLKLGDTTRAKQLLQEVVDQHAGTSAAKLAEAEMRDAQL